MLCCVAKTCVAPPVCEAPGRSWEPGAPGTRKSGPASQEINLWGLSLARLGRRKVCSEVFGEVLRLVFLERPEQKEREKCRPSFLVDNYRARGTTILYDTPLSYDSGMPPGSWALKGDSAFFWQGGGHGSDNLRYPPHKNSATGFAQQVSRNRGMSGWSTKLRLVEFQRRHFWGSINIYRFVLYAYVNYASPWLLFLGKSRTTASNDIHLPTYICHSVTYTSHFYDIDLPFPWHSFWWCMADRVTWTLPNHFTLTMSNTF